MKFIAILAIKDEADIIELTIRINSRVIDHFYIVDNGSTDNTVEILGKLKAEGISMTVYTDPNPDFQQAIIVTKALRSVREPFDWAFILDADEFINIPKIELEKELSTVPRNSSASLRWSTWIPRGDLYYNYSNPLWNVFERKKKETENYEKVIVPSDISNSVVISEGNHAAFINHVQTYNTFDGAKLPQTQLKCGFLDHVPVRSSKQILVKTLTGSITLSLKTNREKTEGYHWDNAAYYIKGYNFEIDDMLLRYLALAYLAKRDAFIPDEVEENDRLGLETDIIKFERLSKINDTKLMYFYMKRLASRVMKQ